MFITKTKWINDIKGKWEKNKQKRILGSKVKICNIFPVPAINVNE